MAREFQGLGYPRIPCLAPGDSELGGLLVWRSVPASQFSAPIINSKPSVDGDSVDIASYQPPPRTHKQIHGAVISRSAGVFAEAMATIKA
ncbi:hypothetical protein ElyMa_005175200 [Elysia marginata]|uniref:Uncharacterized protein n=1 Tax=Elysia marginata TaxID=1093978 RepID=A0AAV4JQR0_9GAST|nr:hypothetical protein ElyMa_005175200 [Elysia marginata]